MGKKAVFFDIDGTLWDFHNVIPESAAAAIRALRKNGHLALLCSGRTRGFIRDPALLGIGFDGVVSGCGTLLEFRGETLQYHRIDPETAVKTVENVKRCGFSAILEGRDWLYIDMEEFTGDAYGEKLRRDLGDRLRSISGNWGAWEFSKLSCDIRNSDREAGVAALSEDFTPIVHNEFVAEFVPRGFDKGTGLLGLCRRIGWDPGDTVAFGDSVNDLEMFAAANTAVCMGNGVPEAKAAADLVTTPMKEDGVWNACRTLGLI